MSTARWARTSSWKSPGPRALLDGARRPGQPLRVPPAPLWSGSPRPARERPSRGRARPVRAATVVRVLAASSLLALAVPGHALDPGKAITQYVHETWTADQGLPQNLVNAILQTRDGYLWLATQEGLARFDGVRFTVFDRSNTPALRSNWVTRLVETRDGTLWAGTQTAGLYRLEDGRWTAFGKQDGLSGDSITCVYEDPRRTLWVGTGSGLDRIDPGQRPALFTTAHGLLDNEVRAVLRDSKGSLWVGTRQGLNLWRDGRFVVPFAEHALATNPVHSLLEDREGNLWVGTIGGGLEKLRDGRATRYTTKEGLPNDSVLSLAEDRQGNLWVGTDGGGLARLHGGRFAALTPAQGLSHGVVNAIAEDHEGSLWIGTFGGGLDRLRDGRFTPYTTAEGLPSNFTVSVSEDAQGAVWVGTFGAGLSRLRDGAVTTYTTRDGLSSNFVFCVHGDRRGAVWVGTRGGGLNRFEGGRFSTYAALDGVPCNNVWCLAEGGDGTLWVGTDHGPVRYRDGGFAAHGGGDGLVDQSVRAILPEPDGSLWMGTFNGGLRRVRGGEVTTYTTRDGLPSDTVGAVFRDAAGTLWVGTEGGLARMAGSRFLAVTGQAGLVDGPVWLVLGDEAGSLWLGSTKGVFRFRRDTFADFAAGRSTRIAAAGYGKPDGMRSQECVGGVQPTGWRSRDGRLWFATMGGLAVVDPRQATPSAPPPRVVVESLVADGERVDLARPALPPGRERLEIAYTALSFRVPSRVLFRYRLEGFDRDWVDAGARRVVYYTNLPPGEYRFRVTACNDDGVWNEEGATLSFSLAPHFHQTRWFAGLLALAAAAAILGGYRLRVSRLRARQRHLEHVVEERTRELREEKEKAQRTSERLQEAQQEIAKLQESSPQALEDVSRWGAAVAGEIARVIGAAEIGVWTLGRTGLSALNPTSRRSLSLEEVRAAAARRQAGEAETIVPVTNIAGETCGALVVSGRGVSWGETEQRLVSGFAHQLGSTLQVREMRRQLAEARERRAATLKEMQDRGIPTLQVCPSCGRCFDHRTAHCPADGARLETPRILPHLILDRYRLAHFMGQGAMGSVFRALDERLQRPVAIKIIRAELLADPLMRSRVEREAHTLARLDHPGLTDLYDFGELPDGSAYLVMELLQGLDLARVLATQGPGTPGQVAAVLEQAGSALTCAHALGIVHRDLKPANLFLVPSSASGFQVKVLDFGLAKPPETDEQLTLSGVLVGTPAYMSPEQVRASAVDPRSDLFSLATVAHELLTGRSAFGGEHIPEVLSQVLSENPPPVSSRLRHATPALDRALADALEKDPARRPRSVAAWLDHVLPLLRDQLPEVPGWDPSRLQPARGPADPSQQVTEQVTLR